MVKINTIIRKKYHEGFERKPEDISQIVIHGTGGGSSAESLIRWMDTGERSEDYKKGIALFHYLIDYNGDVYNIIDPSKWVYHSSSGAHDKKTIGIELMNKNVNNEDVYTLSQYKSLCDIILELMTKYHITSFIGHGACKQIYSKSYKECPGNFDWSILADELVSRGYNLKMDNEYIYEVAK
jgi:N-acetyl-anhydromuramyl-L-alanine amidase AmpD